LLGERAPDRTALRLSSALLVLIVILQCVIRIADTAADRDHGRLSAVLILALTASQSWFVLAALKPGSRLAAVRGRFNPLLLLATGALCLPFLIWGQPSDGAPSVLAVAILLSLRAPLSWWLAGAELIGLAILASLNGAPFWLTTYTVTELVDNAVAIFALTRLIITIRSLHGTRAGLAELAVVGERLRAAAELRAAIGSGLDSIGGHLARAAQLAPDAALSELRQVIDIARRSLAGTREVARGYRTAPRAPELDRPVEGGPVQGGPVQGGPDPDAPDRDRHADDLATALARRMSLLITTAIMVQLLTNIQQLHHVRLAAALAAVLCWTAIWTLQYRHSATKPIRAGPTGGRPRGWVWTLSAQAAVTVAMLWVPPPSDAVSGAAIFLAASILILVPRPWSWLLAGGLWIPVCAITVHHDTPYGVAATSYAIAAPTSFVLTLFALSWLPALSAEVSRGRDRMAQLAVLRERLRMAQDVHDLLGLGLSAITLRAELAIRLISGDPACTAGELAELTAIVARARDEVQAVTGTPQAPSLASEIDSVRRVLGTAGVDLRVTLTQESLPPAVDTMLAVVVREAITNVLRHSTARTATVEMSTVETSTVETSMSTAEAGHHGAIRLRICNDGVRTTAIANGHGTGLANLRERVSQAGGVLSTTAEDGCFVLTADVPLGASAEHAPAGYPKKTSASA
jgi:signal transduction histidine kinase